MLNLQEIKELIQMMDQSSIHKFKQETTKIVIVKKDPKSDSATEATKTECVIEETEPQVIVVSEASKPEPSSSKKEEAQKAETLQTIVSPMIGTFYSAPEPGAAPFVALGQKVDPYMVVCVVEAMKLFNEVEAGLQGEISEILVQDGDFVEYGQPLFRVKPEGRSDV